MLTNRSTGVARGDVGMFAGCGGAAIVSGIRVRRRLAVRLALALLVLALVGACSPGPQAELTSGTFSGGGWSLWTFQNGSEGVCLELRALGRTSARVCGLRADNGGLWRPGGPTTEDAFLAGTVQPPGATSIRLTLAGGGEVRSDVLSAPGVSPLRFYALVIPAGATPARVEVLDAAGGVLDSLPLQ